MESGKHFMDVPRLTEYRMARQRKPFTIHDPYSRGVLEGKNRPQTFTPKVGRSSGSREAFSRQNSHTPSYKASLTGSTFSKTLNNNECADNLTHLVKKTPRQAPGSHQMIAKRGATEAGQKPDRLAAEIKSVLMLPNQDENTQAKKLQLLKQFLRRNVDVPSKITPYDGPKVSGTNLVGTSNYFNSRHGSLNNVAVSGEKPRPPSLATLSSGFGTRPTGPKTLTHLLVRNPEGENSMWQNGKLILPPPFESDPLDIGQTSIHQYELSKENFKRKDKNLRITTTKFLGNLNPLKTQHKGGEKLAAKTKQLVSLLNKSWGDESFPGAQMLPEEEEDEIPRRLRVHFEGQGSSIEQMGKRLYLESYKLGIALKTAG